MSLAFLAIPPGFEEVNGVHPLHGHASLEGLEMAIRLPVINIDNDLLNGRVMGKYPLHSTLADLLPIFAKPAANLRKKP